MIEESKCVNWDPRRFTPDSPSLIVIESKGRLGNHLIAFTLVLALAKEKDVTPFVTEETHK